MLKIKICGLKTVSLLDHCIKEGATHFGLVHFAKSPRHVDFDVMRQLIQHGKGKIKSVILLVDPSDDLVNAANALGADYLQLHGHESVERVLEIKKFTQTPLIKALPIGEAKDLAAIPAYLPLVETLILDAKPPKGSEITGGNGVSFDWELLKNLDLDARFMLSGGLNPLNVQEALAITGLSAVDVSSGVEKFKGEKDAGLISQFIQAVKGM